MTYEQLRKDGFAEDRAKFLLECEQECEAMREYEENHVDAADAYSVIFTESYGIDEMDIDELFFDVWPNVEKGEPCVFLGDSEMEIQLPEPLTPEEADYFSRHTDFVVNDSNLSFAYGLYDDRLVVRAKLYPAD